MSSAVVDGVFGRRKARITEGAYCDQYRLFLSVIRVEEIGSAHRTEPKPELASLAPVRTYSLAVPVTWYGAAKAASVAKTLPVRR